MTDRFPRTRWRRSQTQDIAIPEEASEPQPGLVILERGACPASGRLLPAKCVVLTEPAGTGEQAENRAERTWKFGESVRLPVVDVVLDTSEFGVLPGLTPGP